MYEWKKPDIGRPYLIGILVIIVLALFGWLYHDSHRNRPIYESTDSTMADIDKRLQSIEQRIDRIQERNSAIEKAVSGTVITIRDSRENAVTVADGIGRADERLDGLIQRSGRIQNIIADIENANRQGKKNP